MTQNNIIQVAEVLEATYVNKKPTTKQKTYTEHYFMKKLILLITIVLSKALSAQVPATWTVNPADYQYQMNITAQANQACAVLTNTNNYVAAFVGNTCRGIAQTNTSAGTNTLALLIVRSNIIANEKVTFKIYNATTNAVVNVLDTMLFTQGGTVGTLSNPYVMFTNHAPTNIAISNYTIAENQPLASFIASITSSDVDASAVFTYSLNPSQFNNSNFAINSNSLTSNLAFDFETKKSYTTQITVNDGGGCSYIKTFTINVTNINDAPTALTFTSPLISDGQQAGSYMGQFATADQDAIDSHTYTLVAGTGSTDNAQFYIQNDTLYNMNLIYFPTQSVYYIRARSTDIGGLYIENTFTINVSNVNHAPSDIVLSNTVIAENMPVATVIATLTSVDADIICCADTHTYTLVAGSGSVDNAKVIVVGNLLKTNQILDFENKNTLEIRLMTTDALGSATFIKTFTLSITDNNDVPTNIILLGDSMPELNPIGSFVDTLYTIDQDALDIHVYSLVSGSGDTDNALFSIISNSLVTNQVFTFNNQTYSIRVKTIDNGALSFEKIFKIRVLSLTDGAGHLPSTNYISPNGDGKNDNWKVDNVIYFKEFSLHIYDQFGQTIFTKDRDYNNEFDGKINGNALPTGNYYYVFKSGTRLFKGNITIVN